MGPADISDVIYLTGTNDEGILTLLNAQPVHQASGEPAIFAPPDGAELTAPTTFAYRVGTTALRRVHRRGFGLPEWLTLERTAFAHGAPMNGDAFFVVFSTPRAPKLLRVFTQQNEYAPSDDEWRQLAGAAESITLTVTHGFFEEGRLTADGGPFVGKPIHFTVGA